MWFPFRLTPKSFEPKPGPHYAGYNERAIASTLDVLFFTVLAAEPMTRVDGMVREAYAHTIDVSMFDALQKQAAGGSYSQQFLLAFQGFRESGLLQVFLISNSISLSMVILAYVICLQLFKTSPGKWLMGVKLTKADHETFPNFFQLVVRYVFSIVSCLPLMLGFLWMSFDKQSRTWHDMVANTRVITTRPQGWYWNKIKEGYRWAKAKIKGSPPQ